jgi:leucyl-tRNA---protein transferase
MAEWSADRYVMNTQTTPSPQFYLMNDLLTQGGFRRSQNIAYRPACESCRACISVRVLAGEFEPARSMRRVLASNEDVVSTALASEPSSEQFSLFRRCLDFRHQSGGMSDMSALDYAIMVEDTHVETRLIEYRLRGEDGGGLLAPKGELIAVALTDMMSDGLSMVYSFFNPALEKRSLGSFMVLDHIRRARELGLPNVYLGYWVKGSQKMDYKKRFLPQEHLMHQGWKRYSGS